MWKVNLFYANHSPRSRCGWDFETLSRDSLDALPCLKHLIIPGAMASQILPSSLKGLTVHRVNGMTPRINFATSKDLPNLQNLEVSFLEDTHENNDPPIVDQSSLPKLEKIIMRSGCYDRDANGGDINSFIIGPTDAVHTLILKGPGHTFTFQGENGRAGLRMLIEPLKNLRRLVLWDVKCGDNLYGVSLPILETFEVQWCTFGLL